MKWVVAIGKEGIQAFQHQLEMVDANQQRRMGRLLRDMRRRCGGRVIPFLEAKPSPRTFRGADRGLPNQRRGCLQRT